MNTDEEPMVFKAQLMALTGVQVISILLTIMELLILNVLGHVSCSNILPPNIPLFALMRHFFAYLLNVRIGEFFLDILLHSGIDILPPFQPERQKVMLKGAILGDQSWDKVKVF